MSNQIKVLDHGFVKLRNVAGPTRRAGELVSIPGTDATEFIVRAFDADDVDPAQAARMSFDKMDGGQSRADDIKLATYLEKNWHTGPFEQVQVWFEMKLPIFTARQIVRHRTARLNEVSGRYIVLPEEWYIPDVVGGKPVGGAKQGQSDTLSLEIQSYARMRLNNHAQAGFDLYMELLDLGVAPEHARIALGLGHYTHWLWNNDLHNTWHFLMLRDHSHAQIEAQAYAKAMDTLLRMYLPDLMKVYDKYGRMPE